jgi:hypothetical protein
MYILASSVSGLLRPDPAQIVSTFATLGVAFHLCIRTVEIDCRLWRLFGLYMLAWVSLAGIYNTSYGSGWLDAIATACVAGLCFNAGLVTSITIYRLFLHRLRHFPGPWGAKLSRFYAVKLASKNLQYHLELQQMHRKYGDFVRTGKLLMVSHPELPFAYSSEGPREVSIIRPSAVQAVNGPKSPCLRSVWYSQISDDVTKISMTSSRDAEVHRRRRRAWDRGFSTKGGISFLACTNIYRQFESLNPCF